MRRTGHIRERSPGSFELRYSLGADPATGKRKIATVTVRGSRKQAERELRRLLRTLDIGEHVDPNHITVRDWLTEWLDIIRVEVSPTTHDKYSRIVKTWLLPAFGNHPLARLAPAHIQAEYTRWAAEGRRDGKGDLSVASRQLLHRVLNAALNRAVELQHIARNPAQILRRRLPKNKRGEMAVLSSDQARQLLDAIRHTPLYWPVLLALATGMRRGEVLAVRWRNIDLDSGIVTVAESRVRSSGGPLMRAPKSGKTRTVTLPEFSVEELRQHKREQAEALLRLGVRQSGDAFVCARADGSPMFPDAVSNHFLRVVRRLGLPIHFHSLRHTHATHLLLAGVHPKVAQERLGHATVAMTLDTYSHVTEKLRDNAATKIDAAFRKVR